MMMMIMVMIWWSTDVHSRDYAYGMQQDKHAHMDAWAHLSNITHTHTFIQWNPQHILFRVIWRHTCGKDHSDRDKSKPRLLFQISS